MVGGRHGQLVPHLIAEDSTLNHPGVFLVGYDSPLFSRATSIEENAQKVKQDLIDQGVFDHRNVVFLAHSEGGLVARRVIQKISDGDRLARVKGVLLFAVPVHGAEAAARTYWLSLNRQLADMRPDEVNTLLQSWEADWEDLFRRASDSARAGNAFAVPGVLHVREEGARADRRRARAVRLDPLRRDVSAPARPFVDRQAEVARRRPVSVDACPHHRCADVGERGFAARSHRRRWRETIAARRHPPLSYQPAAAPADRCQYLPCPDGAVTLDALTGDVQPAREFSLASSPRMAVINLNPFAHRNVVRIEARPHSDTLQLAVAGHGYGSRGPCDTETRARE